MLDSPHDVDYDRRMTTTPNLTSTRLRGWETFDEGATSIRALLFGVLADLAAPMVTHYRSDLFHDALWIDRHVNGPCSFFYVVRDYGTHIGTDAFLGDVEQMQRTFGADATAYRITLRGEYSHGDGPNAPEEWQRRALWIADVERLGDAG